MKISRIPSASHDLVNQDILEISKEICTELVKIPDITRRLITDGKIYTDISVIDTPVSAKVIFFVNNYMNDLYDRKRRRIIVYAKCDLYVLKLKKRFIFW